MLRRLAIVSLLLASAQAHAQSTFPTPQTATGGPAVGGSVGMCLNTSKQAVPCDGTTPTYIASANPASIFSFQYTLTASAATLPAQAVVNGVVCKALLANTGTVYVGAAGVTSGTGYPLIAGEAISFGVTNTNLIYALDAVTSDKLACTGN